VSERAGCRVDSPNHLYSYIFAPNTDWPSYFSTRTTLYDYFHGVADRFGLREHIDFNTRVIEARYHEEECRWHVLVEDAQGERHEEVANVVISGTGQLNVPKTPTIAGAENFQGVSFHSARWQHEHVLEGKRIAVIGTGASATQFVPELANLEGASVTVFQRTPPWVLPTPDYHEAVAPGQKWLFQQLPFYERWYRFWLFRRDGADGALPLLFGDPDWSGRSDAVSAGNDELREALTEFIREVLAEDPALADKCIPDYPPGGKRPLRDDGHWLTTLLRGNVELVDDPIESITANGIRTASGAEYPCDVIIYGTGFAADKFLFPMKVIGRDGVDLNQQWDGDPRAFMGMAMPNFPNFYCIYGPNTNIVVGSSIVFFSECSVRYIMGAIKLMLEQDIRSLECKQSVHDSYNEVIDARNSLTAWGSPGVSSWYKNAAGRVTQNWPGTHLEYWQQTLAPDPEDYLQV
jgi:4-hydroxyacetophenone monooxygenase